VDVSELFKAPDPSSERTYTISQRDFEPLEQAQRAIERIKRTGT